MHERSSYDLLKICRLKEQLDPKGFEEDELSPSSHFDTVEIINTYDCFKVWTETIFPFPVWDLHGGELTITMTKWNCNPIQKGKRGYEEV